MSLSRGVQIVDSGSPGMWKPSANKMGAFLGNLLKRPLEEDDDDNDESTSFPSGTATNGVGTGFTGW